MGRGGGVSWGSQTVTSGQQEWDVATSLLVLSLKDTPLPSAILTGGPGSPGAPGSPASPGSPWAREKEGADASGCPEPPLYLLPTAGSPSPPRHLAVPRRPAFPGDPKSKRMGGDTHAGGCPGTPVAPTEPPRAVLTSAPLGPCGPRGPGAPRGPCGEHRVEGSREGAELVAPRARGSWRWGGRGCGTGWGVLTMGPTSPFSPFSPGGPGIPCGDHSGGICKCPSSPLAPVSPPSPPYLQAGGAAQAKVTPRSLVSFLPKHPLLPPAPRLPVSPLAKRVGGGQHFLPHRMCEVGRQGRE